MSIFAWLFQAHPDISAAVTAKDDSGFTACVWGRGSSDSGVPTGKGHASTQQGALDKAVEQHDNFSMNRSAHDIGLV